MQKQCRCCGGKVNTKPILEYRNMPGVAQNFPTEQEISEERGVDLDLYQCPYCGLIQILAEPVPYFRDVIRASAVSKEMKAYRREYFSRFVDTYQLKGKKIIEIGTGKGEFLSLMKETGVEAFGLEHWKEAVEICRQQGLKVQEGFLQKENQRLEYAPFEGFFIMNFLEHIPEPNCFLKGIGYNLTENAVGLIEVPNTDMILKKRMFSEFIADHLMYFTENTLRIMLEKNGFEVLEIGPVWHDYCIAAVVRKRKMLNMESFYEAQRHISAQINEFIDENQNHGNKVAIWGAGHQALAVIALSGIREKVECVIDSAKFKQNRYTPGTHLKIVAPEYIAKEKIGAILVMAASFSDEVSGIIKEKYPHVKVAVLREDRVEYLG